MSVLPQPTGSRGLYHSGGIPYPSAEALSTALGGRRNGRGYKAKCPAHDDAAPSLDITEKDGKTLFFCRAGCDQKAVLAALIAKGAWPDSRSLNGAGTHKPIMVAKYDYRDELGNVVFQVVRYEPKDFRQRRPDGKGGWLWNMAGVARPIYRLDQITEHISESPIFVVEGEKDADALWEMGIPATCNAGGAGKWTDEHSAFLKDAADVIILPDNDDAGRKHAADVASKLKGVARRVRVIELPDLPPKGDVSDWLKAGGEASMLAAMVLTAREWQPAKPSEAKANWRDGGFSAGDLRYMQFPDVMWIVPALFPEGLTLLAGKPKIGKSWLALDLAMGIAAGTFVLGGVKVAGGDVLYCALEDNKRRLQKRIRKIWGNDEWPQRLRLQLSWKRLDKGGVDDLAEWLDSVPAGRLIILDTLAGVRPVRTKDGYTEDYAALEELHRLANERGVAIVVLHHTRKMDAEDPVDQVSGTLGLAGCADTVMVLNRIASGTTLYGRGRDIEEFERAVEFSRETCRWRILGNAEDVKKAESQKRVLSALSERTEPMSPKELAAATGMPEATISTALFRMLPVGDVVKEKRGKYCLPGAALPETPTT